MTKQPTRQELEQDNKELRELCLMLGIFAFGFLIGLFIVAFVTGSQNNNLQSQLTELKQNQTSLQQHLVDYYKPLTEIDNKTADYFCGRFNATYSPGYYIGEDAFCSFVINDTFSKCHIIQINNRWAFSSKCEVLPQ